MQLTVTCWGSSDQTEAISAIINSSSHVTRPPELSRDVRRLAIRRLQQERDRQAVDGGGEGGQGGYRSVAMHSGPQRKAMLQRNTTPH